MHILNVVLIGNYPVLMVTWKWGPALAAGCCVVIKPGMNERAY